VLELDDQAQVISYEEYHPYGTTAYEAARSSTETPKRYRYTGKERDEETGFSYHGARYYAAWLGRWVSCDPGGVRDGLNTYTYVNGRPLVLQDPTGMDGEGYVSFKPWSDYRLTLDPKIEASIQVLLLESKPPPVPVRPATLFAPPIHSLDGRAFEQPPIDPPGPDTKGSKLFPPTSDITPTNDSATNLRQPKVESEKLTRSADASDFTDQPLIARYLDWLQDKAGEQAKKDIGTIPSIMLGVGVAGALLGGLQSDKATMPGLQNDQTTRPGPIISLGEIATKPKVVVIPLGAINLPIPGLKLFDTKFRARYDFGKDSPPDPNAVPGIGFPDTPPTKWEVRFEGWFDWLLPH
jgi:RHS repeat-associated protein